MTNTPKQLADELMAMAPSVEAATAEGGGALLREAAYQLRIHADLLEALKLCVIRDPSLKFNALVTDALRKAEPNDPAGLL